MDKKEIQKYYIKETEHTDGYSVEFFDGDISPQMKAHDGGLLNYLRVSDNPFSISEWKKKGITEGFFSFNE